MADRPHGILEDIGAEIGFTACCLLVDWFGGRTLYVPDKASEGHDIAKVIGVKAMGLLCRAYGSSIIDLPIDYQRELIRRDRLIAALLGRGAGTKEVARIAALTERQVANIRRRLEADGLLPLILRPCPDEPGNANAQGGAQ